MSCTECKGEGKIFLDPYNNIISKEEYDKSSDNEYIECWNCNGKGKLDE